MEISETHHLLFDGIVLLRRLFRDICAFATTADRQASEAPWRVVVQPQIPLQANSANVREAGLSEEERKRSHAAAMVASSRNSSIGTKVMIEGGDWRCEEVAKRGSGEGG